MVAERESVRGMTHAPPSGGSSDWPSFPDYGAGSTYDPTEPTGKPLTRREANLWWIVIVLAIGVTFFLLFWLPQLLR